MWRRADSRDDEDDEDDERFDEEFDEAPEDEEDDEEDDDGKALLLAVLLAMGGRHQVGLMTTASARPSATIKPIIARGSSWPAACAAEA